MVQTDGAGITVHDVTNGALLDKFKDAGAPFALRPDGHWLARAEGAETDLSELVTYLNDAVLLAPSMLLRLKTSFAPADDRSFDVTLADAGQTVTARVFLDDKGRPVNFSTTDRYADLPGGLVRAEWTTPIHGWQPDGDRLIPTHGSAVWQLPEGPLNYLDFRVPPGGVRYNLAPTDIMPASG